MSNLPWTKAERSKVCDLWVGGQSAGEISRQFPGRSRSAIMSVITRAGLARSRSHPENTPSGRVPRKPRPAPKVVSPTRSGQLYVPRAVEIISGKSAAAPTRPPVAFKPAPPARIPPAQPPRHVMLDALGAGECHFPVSAEGEPVRFCGAKAVGPSAVWCAHHRAVVYQKPAKQAS